MMDGGDVGHDAEREDGHALHGAAGKHVEHAEHATRLLVEGLCERGGIDSRHRDVGADAIDDQGAQREPDGASFRSSALAKAEKVQICRKLFCRRCHEEFSERGRGGSVAPQVLLSIRAEISRSPTRAKRPTR